MADDSALHLSREERAWRRTLAPAAQESFAVFSDRVFAEGALSVKMKHLVAVGVAHVTQCPRCIHSHTKAARREGASDEEIMEAVWVAAEMRAGAAIAHSAIAVKAMRDAESE